MKFLSQTVPPTTWLSTADCKENLRVDGSDEDDLIAALAEAACRMVQERVGKALGAQTWAYSLNGLSSDADLILPVFPATSITSISYQDTDDATQTMDTNDFYLFGDNDHAMIRPKSGTTWPTTYDRPDAITITFEAGMTPPKTLRQATLLLVAHWYENRQAAAADELRLIPDGVEALIGLDRKGWVAA